MSEIVTSIRAGDRVHPFAIHKIIQHNAIEWTEEDTIDSIDGIANRVAGERIAATYVNYCIRNNAVLMPTYEDTNDATGLATIRACFPCYRGKGVPGCRDILIIGGSIGCIPQPQYAGGKRGSRQ